MEGCTACNERAQRSSEGVWRGRAAWQCGRARAKAVRVRARARAVRGLVACSARRGRPPRSVEQQPAMPGPRLSRDAWQHGLPDRHHHTQPRSDDGTPSARAARRAGANSSAPCRAARSPVQWQCCHRLLVRRGSAHRSRPGSIVCRRRVGASGRRAPARWRPASFLRWALSARPPRRRRRRLLFRAVLVYKIIIGRPVVGRRTAPSRRWRQRSTAGP